MDETSHDPTVLLVDDEPQLLEVYELWLSGSYDVRTADGGEAALDAIDDSVDVVFLDRRMPAMSGDEVLREFRARGYDCQVAMLTAVDPEENIVDMPFDDYLTKPVEQAELDAVIRTLVKRDSYDDRSQELFSLVSKRAALEASPDVDHTTSMEYQELTERIEAVRAEVDEALDEIVDLDEKAVFQEI